MLDLEIARVARGATCRISGDLTSSTAATLRAAPVAGPGPLELDVSRVADVDRAGLGALVALLLHARRLGASCRIVGAAPALAALLRDEGIDRLVRVERVRR